MTDKSKGGRPSLFTPELGMKICALIANGKTMTDINRMTDMPHQATIYGWLTKGEKNDGTASKELEQFFERYARARSAQADSFFAEALDIARNTDPKRANADRVLIDTLKWAAGRLAPSKYGDRAQVDISGGLKVQPADLAPDWLRTDIGAAAGAAIAAATETKH